MNREFLINILLLIFINLLIKPFYIFGIDRTVQNILPEGDYGLYFALFNFAFLFQIITDFGIQYYNSHHLSQYHHLLSKYLPGFLSLKLLLGLLYLVVILVAGLFSGYSWSYFPLLFILAFNQILSSMVLFLRSNLSGIGHYRTDSLLSALDRLLLIIICACLLWIPALRVQFRVEWFALAQTVSLSLTAIIIFMIVIRYAGRLRFRFRPVLLRLIIRYSYPFALAVFLMTAYTRLDGIMLERLLADGKIESDFYASAFRLLDASNLLGFLFAGLLLPMFSRLLRKREQLLSLLQFSFQMIWGGAISLAVSTIFFRKEIMILLYDTGSVYSGNILGLLMLSFIAMSVAYVFSTLLTAMGELRRMNWVFFAGFLVNLGLNFHLIPEYKAWGAALATCLTQFGVVLAHIGLARRSLRLRMDWLLLFRLFSFAAVVVLLNVCLYHFVQMDWVLKYLLALLMGGSFAFVFRLIRLSGLTQIINENS